MNPVAQVRALAEPQWIDGRFVDVRLQTSLSVCTETDSLVSIFRSSFNPSIALLYLTLQAAQYCGSGRSLRMHETSLL